MSTRKPEQTLTDCPAERGALPEGWAKTTLGTLVSPSKGKAEPKEHPDAPYLSLEHVESGTNRIIKEGQGSDVKSTKSVFRSGDILYGKLRPYLNKVCMPAFSGICSTDFLVFSQNRSLHSMLLLYLLSSLETVEYANHHSKGIELPRIAWPTLSKLPVRLPPLAEQKRIVAKVEAVLERVGKARERLDRVPAILKRFRQSVLAAACSGRLTADWREENPEAESGCELLARCNSENAEHERPKKLLRRKTVGMATSDPPESLPNSWTTATVRELFACGALAYFQDGNHGSLYPRKTDFGDTGVKFVTAAQVQDGQVLLDEAPLLSKSKASELRIGFTKPRDVLLTHNATVGRVAMMPDYDTTVILGTSVTYYRFRDAYIVPEFIRYVMESHLWQSQLAIVMEQTTRNQVSVNKQVEFWLPIPPVEEQREIVRCLAGLTQFERSVKERVIQARGVAKHVPHSVLAKAFAGELLETEADLARREDRDFEPASVLLERIAAHRSAAENGKPKGSRTKKPKKTIARKQTPKG